MVRASVRQAAPLGERRALSVKTWSRYALYLAVIVTLVGAALFVAPRLFVLFDEAYNLNLSKTIAQDGIYASHLADGYRLFDPAVSTGPALTVPLAMAMRLGGANLTTVRAAMLVVFLVSLATALFSARQYVSALPALLFLILFASTSLVLVFGLSVLGDVPAIALALGGLGLLRRAERDGRRRTLLLLLAGVALGLSILSKDIVVLLLPALALAWLAGRPRRPSDLVPVVVAVCVAAGWRALQWLYMHGIASPDALARWNTQSAEMARQQWAAVTFQPLSHLASAWRYSLDYFGPLLLSLALAVAAFAAARRLLHLPLVWIDWRSYGERSVVAGFLFWLAWYYLLSGPQALHRHLLPGIVLGELIVVLLLQRLAEAAKGASVASQRGARLLSAVLAVLLVWAVLHGAGFTRLYLRSSEQRLALQTAAAVWVQANVPEDGVLSGWGWYVPWHIAFLSDRLPAWVSLETPDLRGLSDWFVLSPEIGWGGGMDQRLQDFLARQGTPAFDQRLYPLYRVTWRPPG